MTLPRVYRTAEVADAGEEDWTLDPARVAVLVVEDDLADAFAIQRLLAGARYQPIVARTVAAAKRRLDSVQPAAVLLDAVLFDDEAWRSLLDLRQAKTTGNIPIIVTSSTG